MSYSSIEGGSLTAQQKERVVELYTDGFGDLFSFVKGKEKKREFFSDTISMDFSTIYVAVHDQEVVGFMGISDNKQRCIRFGDANKTEKYENMFGARKGRRIQKSLSKIMDKPAVHGDRDLYIEYLVTDKAQRCKGIASELIQFAFEQLDCDDYYIEVISKNRNAKRLYESLGFVEWKRDYKLILIVLGLGYPITFKKPKNG